MRTTLDIDPEVLREAKRIAALKKSTTGKVLSDLARQALEKTVDARSVEWVAGFPQLQVDGRTATAQMVEELLNSDDDEIVSRASPSR